MGNGTVEPETNVRNKRKTGSTCEICKKTFRSRYHLKLHAVVHTGEKNYLCGICRKGYQQKWNLITHMARVHGKEKPFRCTDCGKAFGYSSHFKRHIKTHFVEKIQVPDDIKQKILNPHKCQHCQKGFDSNYRLEIHLRKHSGSKPFVCDKCGMGFTTKRLVTNHITRRHLGDSSTVHAPRKDLLPCEVCGKTVMRASMRKHLNIHYRSRVYACRYCKKEFLESGQRVIHERKHTGEKPYLCDVCGRGHSQHGNLLAHRRRSHNVTEKPQSEDFLKMAGTWINRRFEESKNQPTERTDITSEDDSEDDVTEQTVEDTTAGEVKKRMNDKIMEKILENLDIQTKERVKGSLRTLLKVVKETPDNTVVQTINGKSVWCCWVCNKKFTSRHILSRHLLIHEPKEMRPYKCERCGKTFTQSNNYKEHVMSHTNQHQFYCEKCGNGFRHKSHLTVHMKTHTGTPSRNYKCPHCDKTFNTNYHRSEHVRTHTREKPYLCKTCGRQFAAVSTLTRHMRTHTDAGYPCRACPKLFKQKSSLKRHESVHSDDPNGRIRCECGKSFTQKPSLKKHMLICVRRVDPVVKPFQCVLCPKRFLTKSDLKRHVATHDTSKNYTCGVCSVRLKTGETYNRHVRRHENVGE